MTSGGSSISSDTDFPFGLHEVALTTGFCRLQSAATGNDPPSAVIQQDDEDGIAILGKLLDSVTLALVRPSQP